MKLILTYLCFLSVIGSTPYYEFMERVSYYKNRSLESSGCGLWQDVLRLHLRHENYCEDAIMGKLSEFDDFEMAAISWIVSKEWDNPLLSDDVRNGILSRLVDVPWWLDEEGSFLQGENGHMEYWSENHQIGWISGQYLLGSALSNIPELEHIILNGVNGTANEQYKRGKERILRWMDFRGRFGFAEYNSDTYSPIAFNPLVTVAGIAADNDIKTMATIIVYLQMFDWIFASHKGVISTPRGRSYEGGKLNPSSQSIHPMLWLLTGEGETENYSRKDCIMLILAMESGLKIPEVMFEVADMLKHGSYEMRERFSISSDTDEASSENIGFESPEDCIFWFGNGAYFTPTTGRCIFIVGDAYNLWDRHPIWKQIKIALPIYHTDPFIIDTIASAVAPFGRGPLLGRSNVYTYRTPEYMMSSVQNYHGGMTAGQQHSWQLTMDPEVTKSVFTTQPTDHSYKHDTYWVGGVLPKIGQFKNTLIAMYNPDLLVSLVLNTSMTHAHFYKNGFDEVIETNHWVLGKQKDTFVALYSYNIMTWSEQPSDFAGRELIAEGDQNVWICHVGNTEDYKDFSTFSDTILNSQVDVTMENNDSLATCLAHFECLAGNILNTIHCLSSMGPCRLSDHQISSPLGQCLMDGHDSEDISLDARSVAQGTQTPTKSHPKFDISAHYLDCFKAYQNDIHVTWTVGESIFSMGWTNPFTYQNMNESGVVTMQDDFFMRYENDFSQTSWGSKTFNFMAANKSLSLDIENISIEEFFHY